MSGFRIIVISLIGLWVFQGIPLFAGTVHYHPDGASYTTYSDSETKQVAPKKKKKRSNKSKMETEAAKAAAKGYKVGQTVKVENGIIYKLAKDKRTGKYTFKRYRRVKKKKIRKTPAPVLTPSEVDVKRAAVKPEGMTSRSGKDKKSRSSRNRRSSKTLQAGRNLQRGTFAVSGIHTFLKRKTVPTSRAMIENGGEPVPVTEGIGEKDIYYTDMHMDLVRLRYGVIRNLELFLDAGFAYDQLSQITGLQPVYGGGFRVNIADLDHGSFKGAYIAMSGEYLTGKLEEEFESSGSDYEKSIDWQEMVVSLESGIAFSRVTLFAGCFWHMYSEESAKEQILPPPDTRVLEDEMEEQGNLGVKGGIDFRMTQSLTLSLEVQALNRQGGVVAIDYQF